MLYIFVCKGFLDRTSPADQNNSISLSGDFIACLPRTDSCFDIVIGDVQGHDPGAILQSIEAQRIIFSDSFSKEAIEHDLERTLNLFAKKIDIDARGFALSWIRIDRETNQIESYIVGNSKPLIISDSGEVYKLNGLFHPFPVYMEVDPPTERPKNMTYFDNGQFLVLTSDGIADSISDYGESDREHIVRDILLELNPELLSTEYIFSRIVNRISEAKDDLSLVVLRL